MDAGQVYNWVGLPGQYQSQQSIRIMSITAQQSINAQILDRHGEAVTLCTIPASDFVTAVDNGWLTPLPEDTPAPIPSPFILKRWIAFKRDERFRFGSRLCLQGRASGASNWCSHRSIAIDPGRGWKNVPGSPDWAYQRRGPFWVSTKYNDPIRLPAA